MMCRIFPTLTNRDRMQTDTSIAQKDTRPSFRSSQWESQMYEAIEDLKTVNLGTRLVYPYGRCFP